MTKHVVYLAAGSNVGDRQKNLEEALNRLPAEIHIVAVSRLYETEPAYVLDQPAFLNIALKGETELSPTDLLAYLKQIEAQIGREKTIRFGPRRMDLDLIFYDDLIVDTPPLQIPHPRMAERGFVLRPLAEIAPDVEHPVKKQSVQTLLDDLGADDGIIAVKDWPAMNLRNRVISSEE